MVFFFLSLIFINLFLYYRNYIFLVFLLVSLYMLGKKVYLKLYVVCCLAIVVFFSITCNYYSHNLYSDEVNEVFSILECYDNYSIVGDKDKKFLIYNDKNEFYEGNKIKFYGYLVDIRGSYNDFYKYLNKKRVYYELQYKDYEIIDSSINGNQKIINKLLSNKKEELQSYLKLILFNVKDENNMEFYNNFSLYSLTYLVAVSGFHINLLLSFFKKVFRNNIVGLGIVSFYLYLLDFSVSSYRAFMCYIFKHINRKLGFDLSNLDIISLIGSVFLICNPSIMFSFGYIFSFLSTFVLEIFKLYKENKYKVSFFVYLVNLPLLLLNYYKINLSTLFFSFVLTFPVSFLYVFSFIFLFLDKFYLLYEIMVSLFYKLFDFLNKYNFVVIFGKPSVTVIIVYYLVLVAYFIFKERKSKVKFICAFLLLGIISYQYLKPIILRNEEVYFLNVGQGDCSVFFIPHSKEVILIDTGGSLYKDIAQKEIIPFLESKGVNKIRQIVLTHDDFDHIGALNSLKENFTIGNVVNSSLINGVRIGNNFFENLNISEKRDNDGSIVLYGKYAGYNILLMGDASTNVEEKLLKKEIEVDIIKVGHHGSDTSSSYDFLDEINGSIAIISVGKNNYGHPHKKVIDNLKSLGYYIFRTDENNDIGFGKNIFNLRFIDYFD